MKIFSINPVRLTIGILVLVGLVFFPPLAYLVGIMMIVAGLTGFCLLEKVFNKLGMKAKCNLPQR